QVRPPDTHPALPGGAAAVCRFPSPSRRRHATQYVSGRVHAAGGLCHPGRDEPPAAARPGGGGDLPGGCRGCHGRTPVTARPGGRSRLLALTARAAGRHNQGRRCRGAETAMTRDDAFLQGILEDPEDDTIRLVFADWLDEHGDADRAEFIRTQIALEKLPPGDDRRPALQDREQQLLEEHEEQWSAPVRELVPTWRFRRGFIDGVAMEARHFLKKAETLYRRAPVQRVHFLGARDRFHELAACPHLAWLTGIDLSGNGLGHWGAFADAPHLPRLTTLCLAANYLHGLAAVERISPQRMPRLTDLDLGHNPLNGQAVRTLVQSALLPQLTRLGLASTSVGIEGGRALVGSTSGSGLVALDLDRLHFGDAGAVALAKADHLSHLTELTLSGNRIGDAGLRALAGVAHLASLTTLRLSYNAITAAGLRPWAGGVPWSGLVTL